MLVDLKKHITDDWDVYNDLLTDKESKLYIRGKIIFDNDGPESLNLTVGDKYIVNGKPIKIAEDGIKVPSGKSIVLETEQQLAVPHNMFGMIAGVGVNIFRNGFVSVGKIDPGFKGKLKLGYYNGNTNSITFKAGDLLACCSFWYMESSIKFSLEDYHSEPEAVMESINGLKYILIWLKKNWYSMLALIVAIFTLIVTCIR